MVDGFRKLIYAFSGINREAVAIQRVKDLESYLRPISLSFYAIFYTDISPTEQRFTCSGMSSCFCC
jgi:hypothetical protein